MERKFSFNKIKLTIGVLLILFILVGCIWIVSLPLWANRVGHIGLVIIMEILFIGFALICGNLLRIGLVRLLKHDYAVMIDNEGIYNNTMSLNTIIIPWNDVMKVSQQYYNRENIILVFVKNHDNYLNHERKIELRGLHKTNNKFGTPVHISTNILKGTSSEVFEALNTFFDNSRQEK